MSTSLLATEQAEEKLRIQRRKAFMLIQQATQNPINSVWQYCEKWVPFLSHHAPGQRGFRAKCVRHLSEVLGCPEATIDRNWGSQFENAPPLILAQVRTWDALLSLSTGAQRLP